VIRETIIPTTNFYTIHFPNEWIGKTVSVIYDEEENFTNFKPNEIQNLKASDIFKNHKVSLKDFKFNRDEANEYE
jgi:hypothetical protein